jgi:hypothetical protein
MAPVKIDYDAPFMAARREMPLNPQGDRIAFFSVFCLTHSSHIKTIVFMGASENRLFA